MSSSKKSPDISVQSDDRRIASSDDRRIASSDDWSRMQYHVIAELGRLNGEVSQIKTRLDAIHIDLASLKATSRIWGGVIGGGVGAAISFISALIGRS